MSVGESVLFGDLEKRLEKADSQLVLYARDLRKVVEAEKEKARQLAEANARLSKLNRLKSDFLSFISHELRTPLNAMGVIDLLNPSADPTEQAELIGMLRIGYQRLHDFVMKGVEYFDWLAVEQVSSTTLVNLESVLEEVLEAKGYLKQSGVDCQTAVATGACTVCGD